VLWNISPNNFLKSVKMGQIAVEGMEFFAYHGCFREEQIIGTRFMVDVYIDTDTREAENTDDLHKTVNYQAIYVLVKEEMEVRSKLLEHVGRRILDRIRKEFPQVEACRVKVSKMNPPVGGKVGSVSVELYL
jgi:7,8-dihydroneopterin aldolase/epimerase/oxygenase